MPPSNTIAKFGEVLDETYDGTYFDGEFVVSIKIPTLLNILFMLLIFFFTKVKMLEINF